jgi:hypothetical protein
MSDDGHQQPHTQGDEPKVEDANAPINIKARISLLVHLARFLNSFVHFLVVFFRSYPGREFHWGGSFLQNQTEHQTYEAPRRLC